MSDQGPSSRFDVVALGELVIDLIPAGRSGSDILFAARPGGAPGNVAAGVARLGLRAGVISKVGPGRFGEILIETLAKLDRDPLLHDLEKAAVPASPINDIGQMFEDPQVIARGMRMDLEDGHGNRLPSVRAPMVMHGTPLSYERPSPRLGEHTDEILAELRSSRK